MTSPIAGWLDILWEAVCVRAARPVPGLLLDSQGMLRIATSIFQEFLKQGGTPEATLQAMLTVLTGPVQGRALQYVADQRKSHNDPDLLRDPDKARWVKNPRFPELIARHPDGQLADEGWTIAEPILWNRASPIYRRLRISENDARDVYSETIADFLKARPEPDDCPMRDMLVFEELPRLFAVVAERRAISWVRKQTTLKMQPNQTGLSFDDIDLALPEPRIFEEKDPLANATFDQIRESCGDTLDEFEWHLIEVLFVEGAKTRDELVLEDWVLQQMEVEPSASRSTKLRRLNAVVADSLARLGRTLENADL
ncbi:hypothetical protein V2O64_12665 [Verrucomicrobiaceae bacterium 227]